MVHFRKGLNHMYQLFPIGIGSSWMFRRLDQLSWLLD
jgi:hypothetical protein